MFRYRFPFYATSYTNTKISYATDEHYLPVDVSERKSIWKQESAKHDMPKKIAVKETTTKDYYGQKDKWVDVDIEAAKSRWHITPGASVTVRSGPVIDSDASLYIYGDTPSCAETVRNFVKKYGNKLHEPEASQENLMRFIAFFACRERGSAPAPEEALADAGIHFHK